MIGVSVVQKRPYLGQLINIPPGFVLSPITGLLIPKFEIELVNGSRKKKVTIGFDSGMEGTHLEVPGSLARELGIKRTSGEMFVDASGVSEASVGAIDSMGLAEAPECKVRSAKVIFRENAPLLVGNDFIRDIGAAIKYGSGGANISCSGYAPQEGVYVPMFRIAVVNQGRVVNEEALFDTGWDGADLAVPQWLARELGLQGFRTQLAKTHTGTITFVQAKADRLALRDLPACYADNVIVDIHPAGSPMDDRGMVIVGEPFFKKTGGMLGYDESGAFFKCQGSSSEVRATRREWFEIDSLIREIKSDPGWLVVGAGAAVLGTLAWLLLRR